MRPLFIRDLHSGTQNIYKFDNGYGASVVQHNFSYGEHENKWELAVIHFHDNSSEWDVVYDTPITDDVIGWLDMMQVFHILHEIQELPVRAKQAVM